jgi:hypothetical protein
MQETKRCSRCRLVKAITEFNLDLRSPGGLQCTCKKCRKEERDKDKTGAYERAKSIGKITPKSLC